MPDEFGLTTGFKFLCFFSDLVGMPYGSAVASGLLALTMFYLFPMVRRIFTWRDYFISTGILMIMVSTNYWVAGDTFFTNTLKVFLLATRLPVTILLVTWIAILRAKPTHSSESPR
jgi:hypothetical protein